MKFRVLSNFKIFYSLSIATAIAVFCYFYLAKKSINRHQAQSEQFAADRPILKNDKHVVPNEGNSNGVPQYLRSWSNHPPKTEVSSQLDNTHKIILYWTRDMGRNPIFYEHWAKAIGSDDPSKNRTCTSTTDRKLLEKAELVILHGIDLRFDDVPKVRFPWQRWVYYDMESPDYSKKIGSKIDFNWTMHYTRSADIYWPYIHPMVPVNLDEKMRHEISSNVAKFTEGFTKRPKMAFWIVSHCTAKSKREVIIKHLEEKFGIVADSFGRCSGTRPEEMIAKMGEYAFYTQYKFYFAMENSLCEDYITEKFERALNLSYHFGIVPVVHGSFADDASEYEMLLPNSKQGIIAVDHFESVEGLAKQLKKVAEEDGAVSQYYQWHLRHGDPMRNPRPPTQFSICKQLFYEEETGCRTGDFGFPPRDCLPRRQINGTVDNYVGRCRNAPKYL